MAGRINLEKVVEKVGNYYETVHVAAKRARFLYEQDSYTFGVDLKGEKHKKTIIALLEIAEGKICPKRD